MYGTLLFRFIVAETFDERMSEEARHVHSGLIAVESIASYTLLHTFFFFSFSCDACILCHRDADDEMDSMECVATKNHFFSKTFTTTASSSLEVARMSWLAS